MGCFFCYSVSTLIVVNISVEYLNWLRIFYLYLVWLCDFYFYFVIVCCIKLKKIDFLIIFNINISKFLLVNIFIKLNFYIIIF